MPMHKIPWRSGSAPVDERTPGSDFQLNAGALWKKADLDALEAFDTSELSTYSADAAIVTYLLFIGLYTWLSGTPDFVDRDMVVEPTTGGGHFARSATAAEAGFYLAPDIQDTLPVVNASLDFGSISASTEATLTVTVPGARLGDLVQVQAPAALDDGLIIRKSWVSAKNTVSIRLRNLTGSGIDAAAGDFPVLVTTPNRIPSLTRGAQRLFEQLLNGDLDDTALEAALGDSDTEAHFWILVSSRWRMQTLLDDADARDAIEGSAIADGILEIIDGVGY